MAISSYPISAERGGERERRFGAALADRPAKRGVKVLNVRVEPGEVFVAATARERWFGSVALGERQVVAVVTLADGVLVGGRCEAF